MSILTLAYDWYILAYMAIVLCIAQAYSIVVHCIPLFLILVRNRRKIGTRSCVLQSLRYALFCRTQISLSATCLTWQNPASKLRLTALHG